METTHFADDATLKRAWMEQMNANTKHTPGPWASTDYDEGFVEVFNKPFGLGVVARCYGDDRAANARLIAAAPDLYEIVRDVAAHFDGTDAPLGIRARAALAKVQG